MLKCSSYYCHSFLNFCIMHKYLKLVEIGCIMDLSLSLQRMQKFTLKYLENDTKDYGNFCYTLC